MKSIAEDKVTEAIGKILKESGARFRWQKHNQSGHDMDLMLCLEPNGETLYVDYHPGLAPFQLKSLLAHLRKQAGAGQDIALCVRKLSWSLLDACKEAKVAAFDLEGNAYIRLPGIYIERLRPSRGGGPEPSSGTRSPAKAARLARAFLNRYPRGLAASAIGAGN